MIHVSGCELLEAVSSWKEALRPVPASDYNMPLELGVYKNLAAQSMVHG